MKIVQVLFMALLTGKAYLEKALFTINLDDQTQVDELETNGLSVSVGDIINIQAVELPSSGETWLIKNVPQLKYI